MNSRVRALVWEELRVGGPIVGELLTVGVLLLVCMRNSLATYTHGTWPEMAGYCLTVVLGAPLLCSLLLVLNIRNSGHLGGGLSRRILCMPVETKAAVTAPLLVRLAGVLVLAGALTLACRAIYGHGPGGRAVMILAAVYLLIQVLDWMRGVVNTALPLLAGIAALLLLHLVLPWQYWINTAGAQAPVTALSVLAFAAVAGAAYGASLVLGAWSRRGERVALLTMPALPMFAPRRRSADMQPFASPWLARFWIELHETGFFLPKMTVMFYVLGVVLRWLMAWLSLDKAQWVPRTLQNTALDEIWLLFLLPFGALVAGALAWRFRTTWTARRRDRTSSEWITLSRLPGAQLAKARLAVAAANLAVALALVTVPYVAYFLLHDNACVAQFIADSWKRGEVSPREIGAILLGVPLFLGLLAWAVMHLPLQVLGLLMAVPFFLLSVDWCSRNFAAAGIIAHPMRWRISVWGDEFALSFALALPIACLLCSLAALLRLGRVSPRSAGACIAAWLLLALALFPFSAHPKPAMTAATALACLSLASLGAVCWPQTVLALDSRLRGSLKRENPAQHQRCRSTVPLLRRVRTMAALAVVLLAVAWLRWPAEPSAIKVLRAAGLPVSLAELEQRLPSVPPQENLAPRLIKATSAWQSVPHSREFLDPQYILGLNAQVGRTALIPDKMWTTTRKAWERETGSTALAAHEALHSGLTACRYPNHTSWAGGYTPGGLTVARLGIALRIQMWVGIVGRRADEAVTSLLDQLLLADTLAGESQVDDQTQRLHTVRSVARDTEILLNRMELPEESLKRLQDGLAAARTRLGDGAFIAKTSRMQRTTVACANFDKRLCDYYMGGAPMVPMDLFWVGGRIERALLSVLNDVSGKTAFYRVAETGIQWRSLDRVTDRERWVDQPAYMNAFVYSQLTEALAPPVSYSQSYQESRGLQGLLDRTCCPLDLAIAGVAADRHRVAKGLLPVQLEELVPTFLDRVPTDPLNGNKPFAYKAKDDGAFEVCGELPTGHIRIIDRMVQRELWNQNATFTVAPLAFRRGPQVAQGPA